jgi:hypothetical protein
VCTTNRKLQIQKGSFKVNCTSGTEVWKSEEREEKCSPFEGLGREQRSETQLNHTNQATNNTQVIVL